MMHAKFSKKKLSDESTHDFFRVLDAALPFTGYTVLADEHLWWVYSQRERKPCIFCFTARYRVWRLGAYLTGTVAYQQPQLSAVGSVGDPRSVWQQMEGYIQKAPATSQELWFGFFQKDARLVCSASILPQERCHYCCGPYEVREVGTLFSTFRSVSQGEISNRPAQYLRDVLNDYFGLVSLFHEHQSQEDGAHETTALVVSTMRHFGSHRPVTCAGSDRSSDMALLKAIMEFVERYAYTNALIPNRVLYQVSAQTDLQSLDICDDRPWLRLWHDAAFIDRYCRGMGWYLRGWNLCTDHTAFIPCHLVYPDEDEVSKRLFEGPCAQWKPTTSGFAAHTSLSAAVEHGFLELIERDACMRWWYCPESAISLALDGLLQQRLAAICSGIEQYAGCAVKPLVLALPSITGIPVVLVLVYSTDAVRGPALIAGSGAAYEWEDAARRAIDEVRLGMHNYRTYSVTNQSIPQVARDRFTPLTSHEHALIYYAPTHGPQLTFTCHLAEQIQQRSWPWPATMSYRSLIDTCIAQEIAAYAVSVTPEWAAKEGVVVVRVVAPALWPLRFGFMPRVTIVQPSAHSCAGILPHCFF